jgi:hypothetical protein
MHKQKRWNNIFTKINKEYHTYKYYIELGVIHIILINLYNCKKNIIQL